MNTETKYLLIGTERSGSSYMSSVLANSGANFGFNTNRQWDRGSGDYEHEILLKAYKNLKRFLFRKTFSDTLAEREAKALIKHIRHLYKQVDFAKYPPLCEYLPHFIDKAGFDLRIIIIIRSFYDYALSHISKNGGGDYLSCKKIYLNMYETSLMNLSLFGGCIVLYEDLINPVQTEWAEIISKVTNLSQEKLIMQRDQTSKPTKPVNDILQKEFVDAECNEIYNIYLKYRNHVFLPDIKKQHK